MKGIILAGGSGTRLHPITLAISKQLVPVYDKPMIYYPLSVLMLADIREILVITTPQDRASFEELLGDGTDLGCSFSYATQKHPDGIASAFRIGKHFIGDHKVALALGDSIFYGSSFGEMLRGCVNPNGAIIFGAPVKDPERYGVIDIDDQDRVLSIVEKPQFPSGKLAIPGLYFFDNQVVEFVGEVQKSDRGEYEITSLLDIYRQRGTLTAKILNRGVAWLDAGTVESLNDAANFVRVIEERQGTKIGCIEEVAFNRGFINANQLRSLANRYRFSGYGDYLFELAN